MFRAPFLAPSSFYGGKQSAPKESCLVTQGAAELSAAPGESRKGQPQALSHLCAGLRLQLPVYPHLLLCHSPIATGLEGCRRW